jgi:hypothetical protein
LPERTILTGLGDVGIKAPRVRGSGKQNSVYLCDPAAVFAAYEDDRRVVALVVLEKHFDPAIFLKPWPWPRSVA